MFKTIKRIIDWCGEFKGKLYIGFLFSFLSTWAAALPVMVGLMFASCYLGLTGGMSLPVMLMFCFFSFGIFAGVEPISDSAHVLGIIENAMNQLDQLKSEDYIDAGGKELTLSHYDIQFLDVSFGYDTREVLSHADFIIPERTTTAIVGPSGSGKTTICNLIARFYDVNCKRYYNS